MNILVSCNCYKRPEFTKLCVPLAIKHAGTDAHWILTDDCSKDGTDGILTGCKGLAKDVKVAMTKKNVGHYKLRNAAFAYGLELGVDVVINLDNDLLVPQNWLRDLAGSFLAQEEFGIGSAWIVNDKTLTDHVERVFTDSANPRLVSDGRGHVIPCADESLASLPSSGIWLNTGACGGAAICHSRKLLEHIPAIRYNERKVLFTHGDSAFNGVAMRRGFKVGVFTGVQCWHLQPILMCSPEYEKDKLRKRHRARSRGHDVGLEESWQREKDKAIWVNEGGQA